MTTANPILYPMPKALVAKVRSGLLDLTPGEIRVLGGILSGQSAVDIGGHLNITFRTVELHAVRLLRKCECKRGELIRICLHELADDADLFALLAKKAALYGIRGHFAARVMEEINQAAGASPRRLR
jgi:DNA-binding CsgD family transcriptional regulator